MPDAPYLEGSRWLRRIQLEVNTGPSHFGQGEALAHRGGRMKRLPSLHLTVDHIHVNSRCENIHFNKEARMISCVL